MMSEFPELKDNGTRLTFLVTYSQADLNRVPSKQVFADLVVKAFKETGGASQPLHWACCQETHADGNSHYHLIIKVSQARRWRNVKQALEMEDIVVHFAADGQGTYKAGYEYVCKEDPEPLLSDGHPPLENFSCSRTAAATMARVKRSVTTATHTSADGEVTTNETIVEVHEAKVRFINSSHFMLF